MISRFSHYKGLLFVMAMIVSMTSNAQLADAPKMKLIPPDQNNQKVIKRYNRYYHKNQTPPGYWQDRATGYTAVFGVRTNSIMSTEDVEVNVVKKWVQDAVINDMENRMYFIEIKNKTNQPIYIDKGHSFKIYNDGSRHCYYDSKRDDKTAKRFITIPPHSTKNLSDYHAVMIKHEKFPEVKIFDYPEDFNWDARSAKIGEGFLQPFEVRSFMEDSSPYYRSFVIPYSKDKDFSTYSFLIINFYMRQLIGAFIPELYRDNDLFDLLGASKYTITNCEYGFGGVNRFRGEDRHLK